VSLETIFKDCATGRNNSTYDPARVLWIGFCLAWTLGFLAFIGLAIASWKAFNAHDFADGVARLVESAAALLAGGGIGVGVKAHAEPKSDE
jgi:hypothetical protein